MAWACHILQQPLQNHPSEHPGGWSRGEMLDGQHQWASCRKDWKRISAELSLSPSDDPIGQGTKLNNHTRSSQDKFCYKSFHKCHVSNHTSSAKTQTRQGRSFISKKKMIKCKHKKKPLSCLQKKKKKNHQHPAKESMHVMNIQL